MSTGQHACPLASCPVLRHSLDQLLTREWLLTDGLGGFASSTVIGCPTRRYHGLLVAAKRPPIERYNLLPGVIDRITVADQTVELSTFEFPDVLHPTGYTLLSDFEWDTGPPDPWVEFTYTHELFEARKRITLCTGRRAVRLNYQIAPRVPGTVRLEVSPLVALRDFHSLRHGEMTDPWDLANETDAVWIHPQGQHEVTLALVTTSGEFRWQPDPVWWRNFRYRLERQRGFDEDEDLLNVGTFRAEAAGALSCGLAAVGFVGSTAVARELVAGPRPRTVHPVPHGAGSDPVVKRLLAAGDQFIVRRESPDARPARTTILAGYPWFGDWGRDSFIALEGLLLIPGRYAEARQVLETFAGAQRDGLIPNRFDDYGADCAYNSVDASLWFIHAADAYLTASGDVAAWNAFLLEACGRVIRSFCAGTEFGIRVDARGLVCCGNEQTQITWMDAKCDQVVFTPRHGRPVEVNALWYHVLHIVAARAEDSDPELAQSCRTVIEQVEGSFTEVFWNPDADCLYDCVRDDECDASIRPNQILAVSLPHSPLSTRHRQKVWAVVTDELLTPYGLRSLARDHRRYFSRYGGGPFERDQAYHNGTVWSWLMGPYVEAHLRVHGFTPQARRYGRKLLEPLVDHMSEAGLGTISEIFDAEVPHLPQGCIAQAWGVAELLRAWMLTEPDDPARSRRRAQATGTKVEALRR